MTFVIEEASKVRKKLRLGITAPSGGGKTYSALELAKAMGCKRIGLIDTEHRSSTLYARRFKFNVISLEAPYSPDRYVGAINAFIEAGCDCIIIDSASHEWIGKGGVLDIVNRIPGNSFVAWNKGTAEHNKFIEAILSAPCHIIATLRSKTEYVLEENAQGKMAPVKKGMAAQTREGTEYEYDIVFDLDMKHNFTASKDRSGLFRGDIPAPLDASVGKALIEWVEDGIEPLEPQETVITAAIENGVVTGTVEDPYVQRARLLWTTVESAETVEDHQLLFAEFHEISGKIEPSFKEALEKRLNQRRAAIEGF